MGGDAVLKRLAIIGGTSFLESQSFSALEPMFVETPYGKAKLRVSADRSLVFVQRHEPGEEDSVHSYNPPHQINKKALIYALKQIGCTDVIGFGSSGALIPSLSVGAVVVPDDYYCPNDITWFSNDHSAHIIPGFDAELRDAVLQVLKGLDLPKLVCSGVYTQTHGPRFETKAEITALSKLGGTVVGMTCAHEATLCKEIGLPYALVCMIDNMANGIIPSEKLSLEGFKVGVKGNQSMVEIIANAIILNFLPTLSDCRKSVDTLIFSKYIVPVVPDGLVLKDSGIAILDGKIIDIDEKQNLLRKYRASSLIDRNNHVLIPGLINCHTHVGMTFLRGFADDLCLSDWLTKHIWPAEMKFVSPEFVRDGTELAICEMIRSGTTCFNDMYFFPDEIANVVDYTGMRATIGIICLEFPSAYAANVDEYITKGLEMKSKWDSSPRINFSFAPHAPYTVSDQSFSTINGLSKTMGCKIHVHLHETKAECDDSEKGLPTPSKQMSEQKCRPVWNLNRLGLVSNRLIAVHMTQMTDEEIELVSSNGASVVHCPSSNMKLASGICPISKLVESGVNVALGTDSASSNNSLNMFEQMKLAALLAKVSTLDPTSISASEALKMATLNGAKALGIDNCVGSLEIGKYADIVAVNLNDVECVPMYNVLSHLVYSASRDQVSDVWVAGTQLMKDKKILILNYPEVIKKAHNWAHQIHAEIHET